MSNGMLRIELLTERAVIIEPPKIVRIAVEDLDLDLVGTITKAVYQGLTVDSQRNLSESDIMEYEKELNIHVTTIDVHLGTLSLEEIEANEPLWQLSLDIGTWEARIYRHPLAPRRRSS